MYIYLFYIPGFAMGFTKNVCFMLALQKKTLKSLSNKCAVQQNA